MEKQPSINTLHFADVILDLILRTYYPKYLEKYGNRKTVIL